MYPRSSNNFIYMWTNEGFLLHTNKVQNTHFNYNIDY